MKRLFIIFFTLALSFTYGQNCKDTLKVSIFGLMDFDILTYTEHPIDGSIYNSRNKQIIIGTMCALFDTYTKQDSILVEYVLTSKNDTILHFQASHECEDGFKTGDSIEFIDYVWQIDTLPTGEYTLNTYVLSTTKDGEFCDSIKVLSNYTCRFLIDKGNECKNAEHDSLMVYPNPAHDIINIRNEQTIIENVELFNTIGQNVLRQTIMGNATAINVSELPKGIYLLKVNTTMDSSIQKIALQ